MKISKQYVGLLALLCSSAGMAATVTVTPSTATPAISAQFTVTISGAGFPDTAGATLGITWNTAVVSFVSGALPASGQWAPSTGAFYIPHPNATAPTTFDLLAGDISPDPGSQPPTGDFGPAVVFTFQAIAAGAANIVITDNQDTLAWFDANTFGAIPATYTQANVTVAAVPVPAAAWLIAPAILAAGRFSRRRKAA